MALGCIRFFPIHNLFSLIFKLVFYVYHVSVTFAMVVPTSNPTGGPHLPHTSFPIHMSFDLLQIQRDLIDVAKKAGETIRVRSGTVEFDDKKNSVDLVTEVDKAVEAQVNKALKEKYPDFAFMGEETYVPGKSVLTDEPTFIVDPIDGTTNFIHFFPQACISLGLAVEKTPVVGVIYNPFLDQLYTGVKGNGAFLNGEKLPLRPSSRHLTLQGSLCAIEWGSDRDNENYANKLATFDNLARKDGGFVHGFRSMGSAALNLGAVAAGLVDSYWEGGCYAWDVCAGWVVLTEAGGTMVSGNPGDWTPEVTNRVYLAVRGANEEQQREYIENYWKHIKGTLTYHH